MPELTCYVVVPLFKNANGGFDPGEVTVASNHWAAISRAEAMAVECGGAVALQLTGDSTLPTFREARALARFGEVPEYSDATQSLLSE